MCDNPLGALTAYKRIITIASCANIVSGFVTSFLFKFPIQFPSIIYDFIKILLVAEKSINYSILYNKQYSGF